MLASGDYAGYEKALAIALRSAKNIVEDLGKGRRTNGTDIEDALKSGGELTHQLAIIRRWWVESYPSQSGSAKEAEPNARLIAAAPDLLAAAEAALAIAEDAQGGWLSVLPPYAPPWTEPFKDIVESLDRAIKLTKEGAA